MYILLVPHREKIVKYYDKAVEYFQNHFNKIKKRFTNLPLTELGISAVNTKTLGYEFK